MAKSSQAKAVSTSKSKAPKKQKVDPIANNEEDEYRIDVTALLDSLGKNRKAKAAESSEKTSKENDNFKVKKKSSKKPVNDEIFEDGPRYLKKYFFFAGLSGFFIFLFIATLYYIDSNAISWADQEKLVTYNKTAKPSENVINQNSFGATDDSLLEIISSR